MTRASAPITAIGLTGGAIVLGQAVGLLHDGRAVPFAVLAGLGLVNGCLIALSAIGLILVYRAARVVNFSQAGFGTLAGGLLLLLVGTWHWNYWLALGAVLAVALVTGAAVEVLLLRRFSRSSRLVFTVVTIVLGQVLAALTMLLPRWFGYVPDSQGRLPVPLPNTPMKTPFDRVQVDWRPVVFTGDHVVVVVATVAILAGLAAFLRFTRTGIAIRGAAENNARAEQLGVSTGTLSTVVWALVALLGAVGTILSLSAANQSVSSAFGAAGGLVGASPLSVLLLGLAAAVIARMESMPTAVAASIGIAVLEQSILWTIRDSAVVNAAVFAIIVIALLSQRRTGSRVDESAATSWQATDEVRAIPHVLEGLPAVRAGIRRFRWTIVLAVVVYPWVMSPSQTRLGATYAIYGIIGISLVVLTGWGGQISLGQFAFVAVGAVFGGATTARLGLPFPVGLLVGCTAAALAAAVTGLPALRIRGLHLAITTLSLAVMTSTLLVNPRWSSWILPKSVSRPNVFGIDMNAGERSYYYLCVAALIGALAFAIQLRQSRTGRLLIAMRDNERTAQACGVNLVRARLSAFAVSGAIAGLAGVLYVHQQRAMSASSYGPQQSIQMFLMAVLGGLGSVYAVLVGALYLGTVNILIADAGGQLLASGFGVLLILLFFPTGLGALVYRARDAWLRRIASRMRIYVPSLAGDRVKRGEEALIALGPRLAENEPVAVRFRIASRIGEAGASQLEKVWRY